MADEQDLRQLAAGLTVEVREELLEAVRASLRTLASIECGRRDTVTRRIGWRTSSRREGPTGGPAAQTDRAATKRLPGAHSSSSVTKRRPDCAWHERRGRSERLGLLAHPPQDVDSHSS